MSFRTIATAMTLSFAAVAPAAAHEYGHTHYHTHAAPAAAPVIVQGAARTIRVSCARYISSQVIWDRPNGVFVEDLRAAGYGTAEAQNIATSVCRDERLVGNSDALADTMRGILATDPPRR